MWNAVITDFTDCINEPSLPDKYPAGSNDYGRVTKGAAYAFRGQAYQFLAAAADNPDEYLKAALSDFEEIEKTVSDEDQVVYLTKEGYGSMVLMSLQNYTNITENKEQPQEKGFINVNIPKTNKEPHIEILSKTKKNIEEDD